MLHVAGADSGEKGIYKLKGGKGGGAGPSLAGISSRNRIRGRRYITVVAALSGGSHILPKAMTFATPVPAVKAATKRPRCPSPGTKSLFGGGGRRFCRWLAAPRLSLLP